MAAKCSPQGDPIEPNTSTVADIDSLRDGLAVDISYLMPDTDMPTIREVIKFVFASFNAERTAQFIELAARCGFAEETEDEDGRYFIVPVWHTPKEVG